MRVIECPQFYERQSSREHPIFLAGGISGCPDWQKEFIARFKDMDDDFILLNPRRATFDITNPKESEFQIGWEYRHLHDIQPAAIVFWFPYNTLCPITLYELGMQAANRRPWRPYVFVGCHPAYPRAFDVKLQLQLAGFEGTVRDNFTDLVKDVKEWYKW